MASSGVHNRVERLGLEAKRERNRFWRRDEQLDTWQQTLNAQLVARESRARFEFHPKRPAVYCVTGKRTFTRADVTQFTYVHRHVACG